MPVKMQPTSFIIHKLDLDPNGKVQRVMTHLCRIHMNDYVPMSDLDSKGSLRKNVDEQPDKIIYESPYAHAQYVGYTTGPVKNYTTPGTGPHWDRRMVSAEISEVVKEVQDYIRRGGRE